ncbi:tRNA (adenosine(37)-N6)-threonylcarbamoyltransferase complex dimerization subunit type 1 TsaB [Enterococcus bulliens]
MKTLAIDTSNQTMALALMEDGNLIAQLQTTVNKNHSRSLLPAIDFLMHSVQWQPKDLERIVVAKGPGSYTGLRIGVTTAKTLAQTLKIPLHSVSSLAILALNVGQEHELIVPLMNARRNNVYSGVYQQNLELTLILSDRHFALPELLEWLKQDGRPVVFVGKDVELFQSAINETLPNARWVTDESMQYPSAIKAIEVSQTLGTVEDVATFVPSYLKKVEAEEKWLETHQESSEPYVEKL